MASGERQGKLWSVAPRDWAELQEPFYLPLWREALSILGMKQGMRFLDAVLRAAGFQVFAEGGSQCDFNYPDFAAFWRAQSSAGNYQPALQTVGPDRLREVVGEAVRPYARANGAIILRNVYRWSAGQVAVDPHYPRRPNPKGAYRRRRFRAGS